MAAMTAIPRTRTARLLPIAATGCSSAFFINTPYVRLVSARDRPFRLAGGTEASHLMHFTVSRLRSRDTTCSLPHAGQRRLRSNASAMPKNMPAIWESSELLNERRWLSKFRRNQGRCASHGAPRCRLSASRIARLRGRSPTTTPIGERRIQHNGSLQARRQTPWQHAVSPGVSTRSRNAGFSPRDGVR